MGGVFIVVEPDNHPRVIPRLKIPNEKESIQILSITDEGQKEQLQMSKPIPIPKISNFNENPYSRRR